MNNIPPPEIESLKNRINIVDLIGGYVALKQAGKAFKGLCPFHSEKDGSFAVYPEDKRYSCFGCGAGGDAIEFIKEIESLDFKEAYNFLADKFGGNKIETQKHIKETREKKVATKFVPLQRDKALEIYTEKLVLKMAEFVTKKTLKIPDGGWYPYYNAEELIDIIVVRFLHETGKDILTFYYDGKTVKMKGYPVLLYNRHHIFQRPDDPIIIHEGEKCCDIGTAKLPDFVHTTWNGGGKKYKYIQGLDMLKGREIYLLSDDDRKIDKRSGELFPEKEQPGIKTMIGLKKILEKL